MAHKSVIRELVQDVLSGYTEACDPELEEELIESLCTVLEVFDDESEPLDIPEEL